MSSELNLNKYFTLLEPIEEYAIKQNLYFACKAINYRVEKNKWDGDRPLAIYIDWFISDNKLFGELRFENPLSTKANTIGENIKQILKEIKIDKNNFNRIINFLSENIKYYKV